MVVGLTVAAVPVQPKYVRTLAIAEAAELKGTLACVRHTRACGNLGAKEVRSFMELCVRMCVRAWFFGCVTRVRSHLKFFNKMLKKRLKTKGFLHLSGSLTFTAEEFYKNDRNNALVFK